MSEFSELMCAASETVNSVLGAVCIYRRLNGDSRKNTHIVIDKNQVIKNDFGVIAGYRVEASILKSEISSIRMGDTFIDDESNTWKINQLMRETSAKWYVDVMQVN